ncbi:MAG: hypothetical protein JST48_07210 [Bacteroidetes bacterium]|nr:hypothetical protein [Bacteroidota bacterium]
MKSLRSIASTALTLLVLLSSTSFRVGMHFCGGEVQNIALFTKANGCEMEKKLPPCHRQEKKSCCKDEVILHNGEDFNAASVEVSIPPISCIALAAPVIILSEVIPIDHSSRTNHFNYDSPLRASDRTVAHRTFLI